MIARNKNEQYLHEPDEFGVVEDVHHLKLVEHPALGGARAVHHLKKIKQ